MGGMEFRRGGWDDGAVVMMHAITASSERGSEHSIGPGAACRSGPPIELFRQSHRQHFECTMAVGRSMGMLLLLRVLLAACRRVRLLLIAAGRLWWSRGTEESEQA